MGEGYVFFGRSLSLSCLIAIYGGRRFE